MASWLNARPALLITTVELSNGGDKVIFEWFHKVFRTKILSVCGEFTNATF